MDAQPLLGRPTVDPPVGLVVHAEVEQFLDHARGEPVAADLVAREAVLLEQDHVVAERRRGGRPRRRRPARRRRRRRPRGHRGERGGHRVAPRGAVGGGGRWRRRRGGSDRYRESRWPGVPAAAGAREPMFTERRAVYLARRAATTAPRAPVACWCGSGAAPGPREPPRAVDLVRSRSPAWPGRGARPVPGREVRDRCGVVVRRPSRAGTWRAGPLRGGCAAGGSRAGT